MTDLPTLRAQARAARNPDVRRRLVARINETKVRDAITSCTTCPLLSSTRTQAVPWSGLTHGRADLVVVGEAPGEKEDYEGTPFVGRSGRLLDHLLGMAGTSRERVAVVNTLACRPPGNRDPQPEELDACRPHFERQLDLIGCWVGVALGGYAIANVLDLPRGTIRVADYQMKPIWKDGRVWIGTYHPAYALRAKDKMEAEGAIKGAISFALSIRFGHRLLPTPPFEQVMGENWGDGMRYKEHYEKKGWALVYSKSLATQIVVYREGKRGLKIPSSISHLPHYTMTELIAMGEAAKQTREPVETVRTMHMVRQEFGGEVLLG